MESLYHKIVLDTCIHSLGSQDPLMKLTFEHEFAGRGTFLYQAARKAADIFSLRDLAPRGECLVELWKLQSTNVQLYS